MAEQTLDLRYLPKAEAYITLRKEIESVLEGIDDPIAAMATMSSLISHAFGHLWVGFYRVVDPNRLLRVGPYQGKLGCLEIHFGSGVCGTAAKERHTVIVDDVDQFPGHIRCDALARSEIVVPVRGPTGGLLAVLDLDSVALACFDEVDKEQLELIVGWFAKAQRA
jgi:GAF domain-containing protein